MNVTVNHPTDKVNFTEVEVGDLTIWFSYSTAIAFHTPDTGTVVSENYWGPTTGKHLNYVDTGSKEAKDSRLSDDLFTARLWAAS